MRYRCNGCGQQFELWECEACGHNNTPEPFLAEHHIKYHDEAVKEIIQRIVKRCTRENGAIYDISALDIAVPVAGSDEQLMPLPYVDEMLAILCGLNFINYQQQRTNRGWACYTVDFNGVEKVKNLLPGN